MVTSLILPCYNPAPGWENTVYSNYNSFCASLDEAVELIIVIDGASNNVTEAQLSSLAEQVKLLIVIKYPDNRGKGYAIRQGVNASTGNLIMYTDIDFPYTMVSMLAVYQKLKQNECDVAIGIKNNAYYAHVPFLRRHISRYLQFLIKIFLSMPVTDTQCGLKGFKRTVAPLFLNTTIDRYLFDLEFMRNCYKSKKYRVEAIPVTLNENVQFRKMNFRILLPEMFNFVKVLFK